jgi:hypothetical protein
LTGRVRANRWLAQRVKMHCTTQHGLQGQGDTPQVCSPALQMRRTGGSSKG